MFNRPQRRIANGNQCGQSQIWRSRIRFVSSEIQIICGLYSPRMTAAYNRSTLFGFAGWRVVPPSRNGGMKQPAVRKAKACLLGHSVSDCRHDPNLRLSHRLHCIDHHLPAWRGRVVDRVVLQAPHDCLHVRLCCVISGLALGRSLVRS